MPVLGAIADDFTGATDLASTLVAGGMRTVQLFGVPDAAVDLSDMDAVVIALKSRTIAPEAAVSLSLEALAVLRGHGVEQVVFKVCSTFDSTPRGNIGPVAEALADALDAGTTMVCPAFPAAGRTVYQSHLFVRDQLLSDSSMRDHPLTPMHDADLRRVLGAQVTGSVGQIPLPVVRTCADAIAAALQAAEKAGHRFVIVDAVADADLDAIGLAARGARLLTGGSGIAQGLPANLLTEAAQGRAPEPPRADGFAAVVAGSASVATRGQIEAAIGHGFTAVKVSLDDVAAGRFDPAAPCAKLGDAPVLVYGSGDPDEVAANQARYGREEAGTMLESALADVTEHLVAAGVRRLVVAGGETSGAVVTRLNIPGIRIGPPIATGVPWTETLTDPPLALALKSGNFGGPDFFSEAFAALERSA